MRPNYFISIGYVKVGVVDPPLGVLDAASCDKQLACGFEPHLIHCVLFLSKTLYPLTSTG